MRILKIVFSLLLLAFASSAMAQVKLTIWSHWAAEKIKRDYVEDAIHRFEAANPGVKIEARGTRRPRYTPRSRPRCAPAPRPTFSMPSRTSSSTWRTACCSTSRR